MSRTTTDRRTARTRHSLHIALNSLILEKGYAGTSIKDITRRANVGRSTFYAHHGSKEGLLLHGLQHLRTALLAAQRDAPSGPLGFSHTFFEHVHQYRELYRVLVRSESGPAVTVALKRIVVDIVARDLESRRNVSGDVPRDAAVQFVVDALFSVLNWWFERNPKLSATQADAIFRRLVLPAFTATAAR